MTRCPHEADPDSCDACYAEDIRRALAPTPLSRDLLQLEVADPVVKAAAKRLNARQTELLEWTLQPRGARVASPPVDSQPWRMRNLRDARESLDNARLHRIAERARSVGTDGGCIAAPPGDTAVMPSTARQEYDLPDGAKLTVCWEADRPATEDELSLLARIARMVEGRGESRVGRRER